MGSELALHTYVFLGNALNLMVNGAGAPQRRELATSAEALRDLYAKVEPMTPNNILEGLAGLESSQRRLLLRISLWCLERLGSEFESVAGVSEAEAQGVIACLEQGIGGA